MNISRKDLPRTAMIIVVALALVFAATRLIKPMFLGSGMFPDLESSISDVRNITIKAPDRTIMRSTTLSNIDGKKWVLANAANAPVDTDKVRALIIALTRLENADTKSANPKDWPSMGLGAQETQLTVTDSNNKVLADLRVGNSVPKENGAHYFRLGEAGTAFIGFGLQPISASALSWTTAQLPKLSTERIMRIQLIGSDLSRTDIERRDGNHLTVSNLISGEVTDDEAVNALASAFKNMSAVDMNAADTINWFNATTFLVDSNDGLSLSGQVKAQAGQYWVRMNGNGSSADAKTINDQKNLAFSIADTKAKILMLPRSALIKKN